MDIKLGNVAEEVRGNWSGSKEGVPVVGLEHLDPDEVWLKRWDVDPDENTFTKAFRKGQLLLGRRRVYQKKLSLAPCDGICSGDITVIAAKGDKILPELLPFYLRTDRFFDFAMQGSAGSLSPRVKWGHLADYEFDLPPIQKQRELSELLWAANDLKESYKKMIAATDEMLKAKFREMFGECGVRNAECGVREEPQINADCHRSGGNGSHAETRSRRVWPQMRFEELCEIITDGEHATPRRVDKGILLLSCRNIINHGLDLSEVDYIDETEYKRIAKRIIPTEGDVLISCSGSVGRCCVVPADLRFQLVRSVALLRFKKNILPAFAEYAILSEGVQRQIGVSATRTSQANLFQGKIKNLTMPAPPLPLQQQFVEIARKADETKASLKKSIADVEQVIKGLING